MPPIVSIIALNYQQFRYVPACLNSLLRQTYPEIEIIFVDNASNDGSVDYVKNHFPDIQVIANSENLFFSKAHNIGISASSGDYIMPLNIDFLASETFIEEMVKAIELDPCVGMVSGKLLQMDGNLQPLNPTRIDSTGLWFNKQLRHFDRGSQEIDSGQYDNLEYIFGPSGAAPLYRRAMLEDISLDGEYFDEDFVIYREDAELAWRAQLYGWKAIYTPYAIGYHLRRVRPTDNRKSTAPLLKMHSVKNRFLMRVKNQTFGNYANCFFPTLQRDLMVVGYVLFFEHSSLSAFSQLVRALPRTLKKRRMIMTHKRVNDSYIRFWFDKSQKSYPFERK